MGQGLGLSTNLGRQTGPWALARPIKEMLMIATPLILVVAIQSLSSTFIELDVEENIKLRSGNHNGKPFSSIEVNIGGGIVNERLNYNGDNFYCTTVDLGGNKTRRCH